jgi:V8-like Glu-specific endopeptidase
LKELYKAKDYGQYANAKGELPVAIISNNDITGGNSGSPVINGNGELVGLAFDGNWEAMSGDIYFDSNYKRTISNDIRYILFMIDKFGGASNLINEMKIVK